MKELFRCNLWWTEWSMMSVPHLKNVVVRYGLPASSITVHLNRLGVRWRHRRSRTRSPSGAARAWILRIRDGLRVGWSNETTMRHYANSFLCSKQQRTRRLCISKHNQPGKRKHSLERHHHKTKIQKLTNQEIHHYLTWMIVPSCVFFINQPLSQIKDIRLPSHSYKAEVEILTQTPKSASPVRHL